jgi:hypothetical protein
MRCRLYSVIVLALTLPLVLGCTVPSARGAESPVATSVPEPASGPNSQLPSFLNGTVHNASPGALVLTDGQTFDISQATMFYQLERLTLADLNAGEYVRTTAKPQPDGTLLASLIVVPVSATQNQNFPPFQFPIGGDDLMNTARITSVNGDGMEIALASGEVRVSFLPQVDIRREVAGSRRMSLLGDGCCGGAPTRPAQLSRARVAGARPSGRGLRLSALRG